MLLAHDLHPELWGLRELRPELRELSESQQVGGESPREGRETGETVVTNRLLDVLGPGLMASLLDLFLLEGGCSLRGRVSHGEVGIEPLANKAEAFNPF